MGLSKYYYEGPVEVFGKRVTQKWSATTYASSEQKARSNFMYQYKKEFNKVTNTRVTLPGVIKQIT